MFWASDDKKVYSGFLKTRAQISNLLGRINNKVRSQSSFDQYRVGINSVIIKSDTRFNN